MILRCRGTTPSKWYDDPQTIQSNYFVKLYMKYIEFIPDMADSDLCKFIGKSTASAILKKSSVLILDEVSMMHKVDLERIEHSLRVLMGNDRPYVFSMF